MIYAGILLHTYTVIMPEFMGMCSELPGGVGSEPTGVLSRYFNAPHTSIYYHLKNAFSFVSISYLLVRIQRAALGAK